MGGGGLSGEMDMMDQALAAIYNLNSPGSFGTGGAGAGRGPSNPQITRWLGDVRSRPSDILLQKTVDLLDNLLDKFAHALLGTLGNLVF